MKNIWQFKCRLLFRSICYCTYPHLDMTLVSVPAVVKIFMMYIKISHIYVKQTNENLDLLFQFSLLLKWKHTQKRSRIKNAFIHPEVVDFNTTDILIFEIKFTNDLHFLLIQDYSLLSSYFIVFPWSCTLSSVPFTCCVYTLRMFIVQFFSCRKGYLWRGTIALQYNAIQMD